MTFAELQVELKGRLREVGPQDVKDRIKRCINRALMELPNLGYLKWLQAEASLTTSGSLRYVIMPTDFHSDISVALGTTQLERIEAHEFDYNGGTGNGATSVNQYYYWGTDTSAYHSAGTVTVTNNSATVTGAAGAAWTSAMNGKWFRLSGELPALTSGTLVFGRRYLIQSFVTGDDFTNVGAALNVTGVEFYATGTTPTTWTNASSLIPIGVEKPDYVISSVTGATTLVLANVYGGPTTAGATYEIDGAPRQKLWFNIQPDAGQTVTVRYYRDLPPLVNNGDVPAAIPRAHMGVVLDLAYAYLLNDIGSNPNDAQNAMQYAQKMIGSLITDSKKPGARRTRIALPDRNAWQNGVYR